MFEGCVLLVFMFFCGMLRCVYVSTFVILSPTDYQSILAELQSPAALHSDPHFLEPELPVTPNLSPAHHQHHVYPESDTPLLATSQPQPLPLVPVIESGSGDPDSPPRSPPRPCELALPVPAFELPDPATSKVRKPHIALNDQLLLSEEEDRSYQEMEPSRKPKSPSVPTMCELDIEMAYSTSSPSLSSVSSITPSSPDRAQMEGGGAQMEGPNGVQEDVGLIEGEKEVTAELEKVVEMVAAEVAQGNGLADWVEQDLIKNVERKCEMITKDSSRFSEEVDISLGQEESQKEDKNNQFVLFQDGIKMAGCEVQEVGDDQNMFREQCDMVEIQHEMEDGSKMVAETVKGGFDETPKFQTLDGDSEEGINEGDRMGEELQLKDEEGILFGSHKNTSSEQGEVAEDQVGSALSPQAWVEALRECHPSDSGSSEEEAEEEAGDQKLKEETSQSPMKEVEEEEGSEEKKEDREMTEAGVEEILDQVEQTEKDVCSLVGWHSDSSSVNVEPPTPGRSVSSDLLDRRER